jgi:hypothetical protein
METLFPLQGNWGISRPFFVPLAINDFVMRPRLPDLLSLLWYGLDCRRSL